MQTTLFWCLETERNELLLMFSLSGIPGGKKKRRVYLVVYLQRDLDLGSVTNKGH